MSNEKVEKRGKTDGNNMAELMAADGEELEWIDEGPCTWNIPYSKDDYGIYDGLVDSSNR